MQPTENYHRTARGSNRRARRAWCAVWAALWAAACTGGGGGGSSSSPTSPTTGAAPPPAAVCRTYPTTGSSVSTTGAFVATVSYSTSFNSLANQIATQGNYSDTNGTRFSYVDTTSYRSTADFVGEVVQSAGTSGQATAGLSTFVDGTARWTAADVGRSISLSQGFGADAYRTIVAVNSPTSITVSGAPASSTASNVVWSTTIIPPVTLATGMTRSGATAVPSTTTNSYDGQGHLTTVVTTSLGATVTQSNTAWDRLGRPTAGTMSNGVSTGTVSRVFDDAARTATTAIAYPTISSVLTEVFDANGIEVSAVQRESTGSVTTTTFTTTATAKACK